MTRIYLICSLKSEYNSVSFDQNNMSILKDKIDELIDETPNGYPHVSVDDVVGGIAQTKRNKYIYRPFYQLEFAVACFPINAV